MNNNTRPSNRFGQNRNKGNFRYRPGNSPISQRSNHRRRAESSLDIKSFIKKSVENANTPVEKPIIKHAFVDFNLRVEIQENLKRRDYIIPTPIQDQTISLILEGKDVIGLANTGTGKTAAFLLPMIEKVCENRAEKVLILAPTRELAQQIGIEFEKFSSQMRISQVSCVGGMPIGRQIREIKNSNPNFIIGTPGRIKDLTARGLIKLSNFQNVVLDEVDRMLDMGFVNEITLMLSQLPKERQSIYFSATLSPRVKSLIETFSTDPITVQVKSQEISNNIKQEMVKTTPETKFSKLVEILNKPEVEKTLIFSETKRGVEKLSKELAAQGFKSASIHGNKNQSQRQRALSSFKENKVDVLIATDVAARGLDIKEVTHVINYTVPQTYDDYIHRIGRTGRAASVGQALTFVN